MGRINKSLARFLELRSNMLRSILVCEQVRKYNLINYILYNKNKAPLKKSTKLVKLLDKALEKNTEESDIEKTVTNGKIDIIKLSFPPKINPRFHNSSQTCTSIYCMFTCIWKRAKGCREKWLDLPNQLRRWF